MAPTYIGTASGVNTPADSPLTPLAVPLLVDPRIIEASALSYYYAGQQRRFMPSGTAEVK